MVHVDRAGVNSGEVGRTPWSARVPLDPLFAQILASLPGLALLQDALEFPALLLVENLLHLGLAFAQYGAVILPEIIEDGFHLLLLGGREVEFALHAGEIEL